MFISTKTKYASCSHCLPHCILTSLFLLNSSFSTLFAQENTSILLTELQVETLMDMNLEDLINIKVISASKREQSIKKAPSTMTVFSRQEIKAMGITTLEELLNFVPGFQASRETVYNQGYRVISRGQSTPQASYNILFMIDGQRLNTDFSGGALALNHFITLANVKQVEIIRGPGSALYGTGAFTGVVNIITMTEGNEVSASLGNLNSRELHTLLSHEEGNWKTSIFAHYFQDHGQSYEKHYFPNNSTAETIHDPRQGTDANLNLTWKDQSAIGLRYTKRKLDGFWGANNTYGEQLSYLETEQPILSLQHTLLNTDHNKLAFYTHYATAKLEQGVGLHIGNRAVQESSLVREQEWQLGIDGRHNINSQHELTAGIEWRQPKLLERNTKHTDFITGNLLQNTDQKTGGRDIIGIHVQHHYDNNSNLESTLGIRFDHYSDFGNTTNPRLGLVYTPIPNTQFKFLYGQAFRAPSFQQLWTVGLGNPNLRPETVKTLELAWTQNYAKLQSTLTYFQSRTKNRIDTMLFPNGRIFANLASLETSGWELDASSKIDNWLLRLTYTHLTETVEHPQNVSNRMFSTILNYQQGAWNVNLNGHYQNQMEQDINNAGQLATLPIPASWVWNSAIRYNWSDHITWIAQVQNLADEETISPTKLAPLKEGLPNRGRTFSLGIEIQF